MGWGDSTCINICLTFGCNGVGITLVIANIANTTQKLRGGEAREANACLSLYPQKPELVLIRPLCYPQWKSNVGDIVNGDSLETALLGSEAMAGIHPRVEYLILIRYHETPQL